MKNKSRLQSLFSFRGILLTAVLVSFAFFVYNTKPANANSFSDKRKPKIEIVRGVTYAGFVSMTPGDSVFVSQLPEMWTLWKDEKWDPLDTFVNRISKGAYPPANGFVNVDTIVLPVDKMLDRYGYSGGYFLADAGASYGGRALPKGSQNKPYAQYKVLKPIKSVLAGKAIPWFGEPGMGMQYLVPDRISNLMKAGYLDSIPAKPPGM